MMHCFWLVPFAAFLVAAIPADSAHALVISEFMAVNDSTITDDDGDRSDWIEIHNESAAAVDLGGYYLTDDDGNLLKWLWPSVILPAGGYLLVWASDKNRTDPSAPLHTNFKLSGSGEYLALVQPDGSTVEHEYAPGFPEQSSDISYGLSADLSSERCFLDPTPGSQNNESRSCGFVAEVAFSVERGFYDSSFSVALATPTPGATIHYTLDASEPSDTHGVVYTGPIDVSTTTTLRAVAFKQGMASTPSVTHTYIFLDDVLQQSIDELPPEYPHTWGSGTSADYDMDPEVVNDPRYGSEIKEDLKAIRTMSIVTDVDHLFGAQNGIWMHPSGKGIEWERPVSLELINPEGTPGFQINCGIRIQGNTSRQSYIRKHSLRLRFKTIYGPSKLVYPLFEDTPVDTFDRIVLSGGNQNSWLRNNPRGTYIRDTYTKDTQTALGSLASHNTYVHLYINGLYWGLYKPTEDPTASFLAEHFGGDDDDWDAIEGKTGIEVHDGDREAWDTLEALSKTDLSSQANYEALRQYLDVEHYIGFMIANIYVGNSDWGEHNWQAGRKREPGAGFKFFSWDGELTLTDLGANETATCLGSSQFYDKLRRQNEEFRVLFGDHIHRHFFNDGALTPDNAAARFTKRASEIYGAVVAESARWGDKGGSGRPYTRDNEWLVERQRQLLVFFPARSAIVLDQFRQKGLYPDVVAPSFNQHGGDFLAGFQLVMEAPQGTIYYTVDGSDPRLPGGAVSPSAQVFSSPLGLTDSVHVSSRAKLGDQWSARNEARFLLDTPLRISEIMYNAPGGSQLDFIELENTGVATLDLGGIRFTEGIQFTFASANLGPGEHILAVDDLAAFEAFYGTGLPVAGEYAQSLSNGGEQLRLEDAAGNAIQNFAYDDTWYPTTDGGGYSLVIRDAEAEKTVWGEAAGWRASTFVNGSPGAKEARLCSDGVDNDGDGASDFPADAGCADAAQDLEDPACNDGIDNDGDGEVDLADIQCTDAWRNSEGAVPVDWFLLYTVRGNPEAASFERFDVTLSDRFESNIRFTVRKPRELGLPGDLNENGSIDESTHLESYEIGEVSGQPKHVPRSGLKVENGFGPLFIDTSRVDRFLVPTAVDPNQPVSPPDDATHHVDHYKCYRIRVTSNTPKYFPSNKALVNLKDGFEHRNYTLRRPKHFCTPVDQDGGGVKNPGGYLLCYPAKAAKGEDQHLRRTGVHTANQFGQEILDTIKEVELCGPTRLMGTP